MASYSHFLPQADRLSILGTADYIQVLTGVVVKDLQLADFKKPGAKEDFAAFAYGSSANINLKNVQRLMGDLLKLHGLSGWWSTHDRSDDRYELCVFPPPRLENVVRVTRCYVFGPGLIEWI